MTVLVPPSIEAVLPGGLGQVDHPIEAREGSQVRLECRAEGIPPPIVRWRSPVSNNFNRSIGNSDSHTFLASFISTKLMLCLHFWFLLWFLKKEKKISPNIHCNWPAAFIHTERAYNTHIYITWGNRKSRRHASVDFKVAPAFESLVTKYIARKLALESSHLRLSNECH